MATLDAATLDDLRDALAEVEDKKPTQRLMAVINYLEEDDATMAEVAERYGYTGPWLSRWVGRLDRLANEPVEQVVYDDPREGRPTELSDEQHKRFVKVLHDLPEEVGLDAPAWSVPLARHYLSEEFDVEYCERHVRRLMSEAGLSTMRTLRGYWAERVYTIYLMRSIITDDLTGSRRIIGLDGS